jgi:hypothetical protein
VHGSVAVGQGSSEGQYRFSVAVAHPLLGLVLAYAGSLEVSPMSD